MRTKPITPEVALSRLEALCARSEQCTYDLRVKLGRWGLGALEAETVVNALQRARYVDDERFAAAYVRDKHRFSRWGPAKVRMGLMAKRIDGATISRAMAEMADDEVRENLTALLRAKARTLGDEARTYDGRTRLFRYGASRGYSTAMTAQVIREGKIWDSEE